MRDAATLLRVESDAMRQAQLVHAEVEQAMAQLRLLLRDLLAGAPVWAADGELLAAVRSLVDTADQAARRSQEDAVVLGDALRSAGQQYQAVEAAAVAERRGR